MVHKCDELNTSFAPDCVARKGAPLCHKQDL